MLERVGLASLVREWPDQLQHLLADGGANLSMGERQLLCLGRALLRPSRILVMDEAASALDLQCDQRMKQVIAQSFQACTTLTIAHRLNTVLGSDRIAVFEAGRLCELDSPAALLARGGLLKQLMDDAQTMTKHVDDAAKPHPSSEEHKQADREEVERRTRQSATRPASAAPRLMSGSNTGLGARLCIAA